MPIPDLDHSELWLIQVRLKERYGEEREYELADCELQRDPSDPTRTLCPTVFWSARDCSFVVFKVAEQQYRYQFFYRGHEQFGTGQKQYNDLAICVTTVLQAQADHEKERAGIRSGLTGDEIR